MARFILSAFADEADKMLDGQIEAMKENGVACVELRGVDGKNVKDLTIDEAKDVRARLDAAGIRVSSMGSPFGKISVTDDFEEHLKQFAHALDLCKVLGCDRMRMFSFYYPKDEDPEKYQDVVFERIEKMLELAEKAGVTLCHENEKGIYGDIASRCLKLIEHFGGRLKCIFDPANFIQCGEKPIENFALLKDHIYYMHIKDALLANGAVVPSGCGDGSVPEIIRQLSARADGMVLTVEPHLTVFDGERERSILSGIAKWFKPEDLIGKKIGIVCNLAPRPMMKGKYVSEGMIFAADTADGGCSIAFYGDDTPVGSRIH